MKTHLIFLFVVLVALSSCSKGVTAPDPIPEPVVPIPKDTTLAGRLNLKIIDKNQLILNRRLFVDSKGNSVIIGKKNGKHWMGCFNSNGDEIVVKTYFDEPTFLGLSQIKLVSDVYNDILEINGNILVDRRMYEKETSQDLFSEDLTRINIASKTMITTYAETDRYNSLTYIKKMYKWFGNTYRMDKATSNWLGDVQDYKAYIYDSTHSITGSFYIQEINKSDYLAISENTYCYVNEGYMLYGKKITPDEFLFEVKLMDYPTNGNTATIKKLELISGIIYIQISIKSGAGEEIRNIKVDAGKGKIVN
ncbi:hypothetical protein ACVWYN_001760 [Pedobacter sp. UYP24]